jgi:2,5-diamino-6-(ribosylamino)-4(3H)-pyrimidinone 5'-phosphate reductase
MTPAPRRPTVWVNCAVSADGRLAYAGGRRAHLSGPEDLRRVQRLRAESQAILVGAGTVRADDPSLRVHWELLDRPAGPSPLRVILLAQGSLPPTAQVFDASAPTLVALPVDRSTSLPRHVDRFEAGQEVVDLPALLDELGRRGVRQLLVEGGAEVLASFFRGGLVDRFTVYVAPVLIGGRTAPGLLAGAETRGPAESIGLTRLEARPLDGGWLLEYALRPAVAPGGSTAPL